MTLLDKLVPLEDIAAKVRRDGDAKKLRATWRQRKGTPTMYRAEGGRYLVDPAEVDAYLAARKVSGPERDAVLALCRPARKPIVAPPSPQSSRRSPNRAASS